MTGDKEAAHPDAPPNFILPIGYSVAAEGREVKSPTGEAAPRRQ